MKCGIWLRLLALPLLFAIALPADAQTTRTWTGAVDDRWSVAGNWDPSGVPAAGDSLVFLGGAANTITNNDLPPGTAFARIEVPDWGWGYQLGGNGIGLTESWYSAWSTQASLPIDVGANAVTFSGYLALSGALSGTGPVLVSGDLALSGTHGYAGTLTVQGSLNLDDADLSQATLVVEGALLGSGRVGAVHWPGWWLALGVGRLETGDFTATGGGSLDIVIQDAIPGFGHGQVSVTGGVDLGTGKQLYPLFDDGFVPVPGQELVLIDNDGSDPIQGEFLGLAEGAILTHNGAQLQVSYVGGDGNDFSLTCIFAPRVWNGSVNGLWSEPDNWTPAGVPAAGEYLRFPLSGSNRATTNDLPAGTSFSRIEVTSFGYTLGGNGIELTESLSGGWGTQFTLPIDVASHAVSFSGSFHLSGALSGNGPVLVTGNPTFAGVHSYQGTLTIQGFLTLEEADLSNAAIVLQGALWGTGGVGSVDWQSGIIDPGTGRLTARNLSASGWGDLTVYVQGPVAGDSQGQLRVSDGIDLGTQIALDVGFDFLFVPTSGMELVLIDNQGSDPIQGEFLGLAEGAILSHNGAQFQVSYAGGDGNDFSLTCVSAPRVWNGSVNGLWSEPDNWTPTGVPAAGEYLRFPFAASSTNTTNDLPAGTSFSRIEVTGFGYTLGGNGIELTESLSGFWNTQVTLPIDVASNAVSFSGSFHLSGALSGNGPVLVTGYPIIAGVHGYQGTFTNQGFLTLEDADLSDAAIVLQGALWGTGEVGSVDWLYGDIEPGTGRLTASNLSASGWGNLTVYVQGPVAGDSQGQLRVSDGIDLGTEIGLDVGFDDLFVPTSGMELVLIDNEGSDPIQGEFLGLAEGAILTHNGAQLQVSYAGGDGNDFSLTCISAPRVWNGSVSGLWSEPDNWTPAGVPVAGEYLRFPFAASNTNTTNDLPAGTSFSRIEVTGSGYTLGGNGIELTESLAGDYWGTLIALPIDVAGHAITLTGSPRLAGPLSGSGSVLIGGVPTITGMHSFAGTITVQNQLILDSADLSSATVMVQGYLSGTGTVGPVFWSGLGLDPGLGRIDMAGLTATGSGNLFLQLDGAIPGISHGQVRVAGSVDLGEFNALLVAGGFGFVPSMGHEWVLIDNDGNDPIVGSLSGLSEGDTVFAGSFSYRLSYVGGDGNDLSLTSLDGRTPTSTSLVSSANPSQPGQWVTLTATVTGDGPTPSGEVVFRDGADSIGTVSLDVGGTAVLSTSSLAAGSRSITAEYRGGPNHGGSASAPLIQDVGEIHSLVYSAGPNGSLSGATVQQVIAGGSGSAVTALPDSGYYFAQWSDGATANPRTDTNVSANLSVEAQFAPIPNTVDLQVAKDNGLQAAMNGQELVYAITVANAGPLPVSGAQLVDALPAELVDAEWACLPAESNTACPAPPFDAGTGDLYAEIDLPVGGFLRYDLSARIDAGSGAVVSNTATVAPPAGWDDLDESNNSATDTTLILPLGIFGHGFEAVSVPLTVPAAAKAQREAAGR